MKEIKFRAWDKNGDGMFYNIQNGISFEDGSQYDFSSFLEKQNDDIHDWIVMQYTGLKDKNGKEIYEGDILSVPVADGNKYEVIFNDGGFTVKNLDEYTSVPASNDYLKVFAKQEEVIGNKFENPELI